MEEGLLVVLMAVLLIHVTFMILQTLPQHWVLDAINLKNRKVRYYI